LRLFCRGGFQSLRAEAHNDCKEHEEPEDWIQNQSECLHERSMKVAKVPGNIICGLQLCFPPNRSGKQG
jgi:hypothetical protein